MMISCQLMLHAEMRRPRKNQPRPILVLPCRVSTLRLRDFSFPERCRRLSGLSGQHSSLSFRSGLAQSIVTTDIERLTLIYSMPDRSKNEDVRWRQRFQNFRKAFSQLSKAAALAQQRELTELEQQGLIQAFEFTHELAWNTLKDFLESRGRLNLFGSKDATREAFGAGLIENGDAWMQMIENRNETTHTYDEETADEIADAILSRYVPEFEKFQIQFLELEREETK
jgi:nucleotidyltransferase substrate binding protein (TIGR01987 family)